MTCNCEENNPLAMFGVGKLQRGNPIPAGVYWIDVIGPEAQAAFAAWGLENAAVISIIATEHFESLGWPDCPVTEDCGPPRDWVKFQVSQAVDWNQKALGFPNIIAPGDKVDSAADTASTPDFSDNCDIACQAEKVAIAGGVLLGGVALVLIVRSFTK